MNIEVRVVIMDSKLELFLKQIEYSYCKYLKHTFNFNNFLLNTANR